MDYGEIRGIKVKHGIQLTSETFQDISDFLKNVWWGIGSLRQGKILEQPKGEV